LIIRNSTIFGNTAAVVAGIYFGNNGSLLLENSTVSGNTSTGEGGGVYFFGTVRPGGFTIRNSTISNNTAATNGGGICLNTTTGAVTIQNSTVAGNTASNTTPGGGGISQSSGDTAVISVVSTIVSGNNSTAAPDISSPATSAVNVNNSAIGSATGFTLSGTSGSNLAFGANLNLQALASNGGPTQTRALGTGSLAINAGSNPASLATDQRGTGFARVANGAADIGAFEVQSSLPSVSSAVVNAGQVNTVQRSAVTNVTVTFDRVVTFAGAPSAAFQLARISPGAPTGNVTLTVDLTGSTATQTIAKLTFSGSLTEGFATAPSLIDGNYTLTVFSSQIQGGLNGGDNVTPLFRYYGDIDGNRAVNGLDLGEFRTAFGTSTGNPNYRDYLDKDGNGAINGLDLPDFRSRFGTTLLP